MKRLLVTLVMLNTVSAFAQNLKYENLPRVQTFVSTVDKAASVSSKHIEDRKQALKDLRFHVEKELGRQVIEEKCDTPRKEKFNNEDAGSRSSTCSVSFL